MQKEKNMSNELHFLLELFGTLSFSFDKITFSISDKAAASFETTCFATSWISLALLVYSWYGEGDGSFNLYFECDFIYNFTTTVLILLGSITEL